MINTHQIKTQSGTTVGITPRGITPAGEIRAELVATIEHPKFGTIEAVGHSYNQGFNCYATINGRSAPVTLTISREDYDRLMAEADQLAGEARQAETAKQAASEADEWAKARAACPAGFVPCRQIWANGDLASAKYQTEDGTEIIASDLLESHDGWYYIPVETVEVAKAKAAANAKTSEPVKPAPLSPETAGLLSRYGSSQGAWEAENEAACFALRAAGY